MNYSIADAVEDGQWMFDEHDAYEFWGKVAFSGGDNYLEDKLVDTKRVAGECWVWQGASEVRPKGLYGTHSRNGVKALAHRLAYMDFGGKLPNDKVIDHLCRNTLCVRPSHLEAVTQAENVQRGEVPLLNRGVCKHGHEITPDNLTRRKRRGAYINACKTCLAISARKTYLKQKSESESLASPRAGELPR